MRIRFSAFVLCGLLSVGNTAAFAQANTFESLRIEKKNTLAKRDPHFGELIIQAEAILAKRLQTSPQAPTTQRLQKELNSIILNSGNMGSAQQKANIELLQAVIKAETEPNSTALISQKERYDKICQQLDDLILSKDLDRALHIHDKLVRYTALKLWDQNKIDSELERIETLIANAPDLPYGRSELISGYKNKRLVAPPELHYLGSYPHEEVYLTSDRPSAAVLEDTLAAPLKLETADHKMDDGTGTLVDITQTNRKDSTQDFSPPLSLWMKSRILEGKIPAITFSYSGSVQDILDGKLDDYFKRNLLAVAETKTPVLIGLFNQFDGELAANAFGSDGRTDCTNLASSTKTKKSKNKTIAAELCNQYSDPTIPDGPERVAAAWKHIKSLVSDTTYDTISFYSCAAPFHGNKFGKNNQDWNKLDYYYPGDNIIDWLGSEALGSDPLTNPKGPNLMECLSTFMAEARSSNWQATPVMLRGLSPNSKPSPQEESPWLTVTFQKIIPDTFPNINIVFLSALDNVTLWNRDAVSTFRTVVSSNKIYGWPLRFKLLNQK
ncbi:MAG: hypothetical protein K2W82_13135 [Candidatus Obscuribacterales bacterium]|nr:hypothetical protein [Candidatus Obscuribacterales bacterium]